MESASNCSTWQNNYTGACKELCQTSPLYYNNRKFSPAFNVACVYNTSFRKITIIFVLQVWGGQVRDLGFVSEVETELESFCCCMIILRTTWKWSSPISPNLVNSPQAYSGGGGKDKQGHSQKCAL